MFMSQISLNKVSLLSLVMFVMLRFCHIYCVFLTLVLKDRASIIYILIIFNKSHERSKQTMS